MYGYKDSGDVAPGKQGGKFGLNQGFITKFEFNATAGKDGSAGEAIDLTVQVGEREYRNRIFPIGKVFKDNAEVTDTSSKEYKDLVAKETDLLNAYISDIVKCFVSAEDLQAALATPISSFRDYANIITTLVQRSPNWQTKPVDVFLQYQWSPSGDNDRTYLELPKNVKHGIVFVASQGKATEVKTDTSLSYTKEDGSSHPFKRGEWFMASNFANPINLKSSSEAGEMNAATADGDTW